MEYRFNERYPYGYGNVEFRLGEIEHSERHGNETAGFVPSNPEVVYRALRDDRPPESPGARTEVDQVVGRPQLRVRVQELDVDVTATDTTATYRCRNRPDVARVLGLSQLAFMVALARRATRHEIVPNRVTVIGSTHDLGGCTEFFDCEVRSGEVFEVSFDALDASRPFLTRNDEMWETFQPGLRRRAAEAGEYRSVRDEVEEALFVLLPSGRAAMSDVASELGIGGRTLQRRLAAEGTSWLDVLNSTRETLARYYFESTQLNATEVSFLLGFADPNSLFRAFQRWTGTTPESWRAELRSTS